MVNYKNCYTFNEKQLLNKSYYLCDSNGKLISSSVGWCKNPCHICNLKGNWLRKKKFNYWNITNDNYLFNLTLTNFDYVSLISVYMLDFSKKTQIEESFKIPLGKNCALPDNVYGDINISYRSWRITVHTKGVTTKIKVTSSNFNGSKIHAYFEIHTPQDKETLNIVIPWNLNKFHFTSKQNCLPVSGYVCLDDSEKTKFDLDSSLASLDFGRGIWPYHTFWNWCSFSGKKDNMTLGINLGSGWTDGTGLTENAISIDNSIIKISDKVIFDYNKLNMMKPWNIKTINSNSINLIFTPFIKKISNTNLLIIKSNFSQLYGYFSGTITLNDKVIYIDNIFGTVEEHIAKW